MSWILDACLQLSATLPVIQKGIKVHFWHWEVWGFFKEVFFAPWNINGEDYSSAFVHEIFHDPWENLLRYQLEHTWVHHQHLWRGYSAPICVTETLDTCSKYYTFSRTNLAPSNLMDAFIFYSTHLLVPRTWLYFPWVLSGHHCNHWSGTICSKQPIEPVIYQEQSRHFGEGHNCICVGVILLSQMGHSA